MGNPFYIVDVFGEKKYQGNQLAVVNVRDTVTDGEMQKFAREINFSETTYILSGEKRNGGYDVRIFTPQTEVPFAGHPTLGTAYVLQQEIIGKPVNTVVLNLKVGQIVVDIIYKRDKPDLLWMKQVNPTFGQVFKPEALARILNLGVKAIDDKYPIQEVSTGLPFIIVPLKTLETMKNIKVNKEGYFNLISGTKAKAILVFCPQTDNSRNDLHVRVFCDYYGIPEDPATGSGNGCLAGYLVKHRYYKNHEIAVRVEQGQEIGRPSLIHLKAREIGEGKIEVMVGGKVIPVARGEII
jgi:trans-2,3-dihydro-3-hydroxyanthranilate isomerase